MDENYCKNCQHFKQHYTLSENKLIWVHCGHCTYSTPKVKRPDKKACEHFELSKANCDCFVSKEYLSKKLLERILEMELLPRIEVPAGSQKTEGKHAK